MTDEELERITRSVARAAFHAGWMAGRQFDGALEEESWREWEGTRTTYGELMAREEEAS